MTAMPLILSEERWGLRANGKSGPFLLGVHCWPGLCPDTEPRTRTFRTRALALAAAATSCYPEARPVRILLTVLVIHGSGCVL